MADTVIDAVKKQKNAEYAKQYRLRRKFLLQQQPSTSSESELAEKRKKKAEYSKQYRLKRKLLLQQQPSTSSESGLAEKRKKKAEYAKQYRLKRKLQMQQQASFRHRFKKVNSRYKYLNLRGESVK
jgi:ribosomal protein S8E